MKWGKNLSVKIGEIPDPLDSLVDFIQEEGAGIRLNVLLIFECFLESDLSAQQPNDFAHVKIGPLTSVCPSTLPNARLDWDLPCILRGFLPKLRSTRN